MPIALPGKEAQPGAGRMGGGSCGMLPLPGTCGDAAGAGGRGGGAGGPGCGGRGGGPAVHHCLDQLQTGLPSSARGMRLSAACWWHCPMTSVGRRGQGQLPLAGAACNWQAEVLRQLAGMPQVGLTWWHRAGGAGPRRPGWPRWQGRKRHGCSVATQPRLGATL
jgi:hypothetical protein